MLGSTHCRRSLLRVAKYLWLKVKTPLTKCIPIPAVCEMKVEDWIAVVGDRAAKPGADAVLSLQVADREAGVLIPVAEEELFRVDVMVLVGH